MWGETFATRLVPGAVVALYGGLGAGKTTLIKGVVSKMAGVPPNEITSPTFTYLNIYESIYHFDLYRLRDEGEFRALGFEEYLEAGGVCLIEWPERITSLLPAHTLALYLTHVDEHTREIRVA